MAGSAIDCPVCGKRTRLNKPNIPRPVNFAERKFKTSWWTVAWIVLMAFIILLACSFDSLGKMVGSIVGTGATAAAAAIGAAIVFAVVALAIYWLLFPLFVYNKLDKIISLFTEIRDKK